MQAQQMAAFFLFAVAAAVTPGPSNLLVMAAGARGGWQGGLRCLAGVVVGMALLIGVAAFGLAGVLQAWPGLLMALRAGGSLFLLWLAWQIAKAPPMRAGGEPPPAGFGAAFALQWVNPKSWIVGASAAATFSAAPGQPAATHAALLAVLFALAAAPSCAVWLVGGAMLQRWMKDARRARWVNGGMGLLLAASVVMLWT
ncbi:LysE family translocator [Ramlibacter sp. WS9]|uniref:LysE family translocator n=1 Tax=Ramlibacter sp. WS9 TaxID=1882741 RepID=UPI0011426083|nr:LysE family translocator [Ramlibacter sp. WS9]ROZ74410.1 LysE family translocator [Ramlibacter sp. WS9]